MLIEYKARQKSHLLILMASESHTVSSMKGPMTVRVAKVNFIDEEAHRERPVPAEQVVLVPYVDMLYI